jgi:RNA polymerase sigma factor (sigma-70 family)
MKKVLCFPRSRRDRLIESCLHLVEVAARSIARRLPPSFELDDLIGEGHLGLVEAADSHNGERGTFEMYARAKINFAIIDSIRRRKYIANTMEPLEATVQRPVDQFAVFSSSYLQVEAWERIQPGQRSSQSEETLISAIDEERKQKLLSSAIDDLAPRLQIVFRTHYRENRQIAVAARKLGVDPSRASQMHHEGLHELARGLRRRGVRVEYSELRAAVVHAQAA